MQTPPLESKPSDENQAGNTSSPPKRRRRARGKVDVEGDPPIEIATMKAIRGGSLKQDWIVLPTVDDSGIECVRLSSQSKWLQQICFGTTSYKPSKSAALNFVLEGMLAQLRAPENRKPEAVDEGRPSGREVLENISESEDDSEMVAQRLASVRKTKRARPKAEFRTIEVNSAAVLAKAGRGGCVFMAAEAPAIQALFGAVADAPLDDDGKISPARLLRPTPTSPFGVDPRTLLVEKDQGRVRWSPRENTFTVHWKSRSSPKAHVTYRNFSPPLEDYAGDPWQTEHELLEVIKQTLLKARKVWDQLDGTTEPRYFEPDDNSEHGEA